MSKSSYTIEKSTRYKVTFNINGVPVVMHLKDDLTIDRPFTMDTPVSLREFNYLLGSALSELGLSEREIHLEDL